MVKLWVTGNGEGSLLGSSTHLSRSSFTFFVEYPPGFLVKAKWMAIHWHRTGGGGRGFGSVSSPWAFINLWGGLPVLLLPSVWRFPNSLGFCSAAWPYPPVLILGSILFIKTFLATLYLPEIHRNPLSAESPSFSPQFYDFSFLFIFLILMEYQDGDKRYVETDTCVQFAVLHGKSRVTSEKVNFLLFTRCWPIRVQMSQERYYLLLSTFISLCLWRLWAHLLIHRAVEICPDVNIHEVLSIQNLLTPHGNLTVEVLKTSTFF